MPKPPKTIDFATTLAELEAIVAKLEDEGTSLEQSLADFEKGVGLIREAQQSLSGAEQKVAKLLEAQGEPVLEPFQDSGDAE
jgi:exodeoxyribonuclease VII small subunit